MTDKRKEEGDLARYFQEHRDDDDEWSAEAEVGTRRQTSLVVYSVRFRPTELSELRRLAASRGLPLSELIRASVLQHVREIESPAIEVYAPAADKFRFFGHAQAPRGGTRGPEKTPAKLTGDVAFFGATVAR